LLKYAFNLLKLNFYAIKKQSVFNVIINKGAGQNAK